MIPKLYISDGAVWLLVVFYLPLVGFVLWQLWHRLSKNFLIKMAGVLASASIAAAIPLWDVFRTSVKMAKLCPQAGIKINRTVTVDGFYTNLGGSDDLKRGFKYVEAIRPGNRIEIYTISEGEFKKHVIETEKTPYLP